MSHFESVFDSVSPYLICTGLRIWLRQQLNPWLSFLSIYWLIFDKRKISLYTRELDTAWYRDCWQEKNNLKCISKLVGHQNSWCIVSLILKVSGRLLENETQFSIIWRYYFIWCLDDSGGEIYVTNPSWISHRIKYLNAKKYVCIL